MGIVAGGPDAWASVDRTVCGGAGAALGIAGSSVPAWASVAAADGGIGAATTVRSSRTDGGGVAGTVCTPGRPCEPTAANPIAVAPTAIAARTMAPRERARCGGGAVLSSTVIRIEAESLLAPSAAGAGGARTSEPVGSVGKETAGS